MAKLNCQQCGQEFYASPSRKRQFCGLSCAYDFRRGVPLSQEHRRSISKGHLGNKQSNAAKARMADTVKAKFSNPVNHPWYGKHLSEEHKKAISKANKGRKRTKALSQRMAKVRQLLWQDPKYVARVMASRSIKPTKPEIELGNILNTYFPQYKYNGDGSLGVTLAGMIPDFVNVNGKKEVIELFGDYYHSSKMIGDDWRRSELGRLMAYNSLGYRCLVIWEYELGQLSEEEIVAKIKKFKGRKHAHATHP